MNVTDRIRALLARLTPAERAELAADALDAKPTPPAKPDSQAKPAELPAPAARRSGKQLARWTGSKAGRK
jgi:hypothetical protein